MKKYFLFVLFLTLFIVGCNGKKIRPDVSEFATDANYLTAEFSACKTLFNGIGICEIEKGQDVSSLDLSIQGYYQGTITMASNCNVDDKPPTGIRYQDGLNYKVPLRGQINESCIVSMLVSPEYPNEKKQPIQIGSLKGHLWIRVVERNWDTFNKHLKIKEGSNPSEVISIPATGREVEVILKGGACNVDFTKVYPVTNGRIQIKVKDFMKSIPLKVCPIAGVAFVDKRPVRLSIFIDGYSRTFQPLPIPKTSVSGKKLTIVADTNVTAISVGNVFELDHQGTFDFDPNKSIYIRALTVKGRLVIGRYSGSGKGFVWIQ